MSREIAVPHLQVSALAYYVLLKTYSESTQKDNIINFDVG